MAKGVTKKGVKWDNTPKHDWNACMEFYVQKNLDPERKTPFTVAMVAEHFGVPLYYCRNRASQMGWSKEVRRRKDKARADAIKKISKTAEFDEYEIRTRHAKIARFLSAKAMTKLQNLEPKDLTVQQSIDILKVGVELERVSVGIPDINARLEVEGEPSQSVSERMEQHAQMRRLGEKLIDLVEKKGVFQLGKADHVPLPPNHPDAKP